MIMTHKRLDEVVRDQHTGLLEVNYRLTYECEKLQTFFGQFMQHDTRVFNEDCTIEYVGPFTSL